MKHPLFPTSDLNCFSSGTIDQESRLAEDIMAGAHKVKALTEEAPVEVREDAKTCKMLDHHRERMQHHFNNMLRLNTGTPEHNYHHQEYEKHHAEFNKIWNTAGKKESVEAPPPDIEEEFSALVGQVMDAVTSHGFDIPEDYTINEFIESIEAEEELGEDEELQEFLTALKKKYHEVQYSRARKAMKKAARGRTGKVGELAAKAHHHATQAGMVAGEGVETSNECDLEEGLKFKPTGLKVGGTGMPSHVADTAHGQYQIYKAHPSVSKHLPSHPVHFEPHGGKPEHVGDAHSHEEAEKLANEHHKKLSGKKHLDVPADSIKRAYWAAGRSAPESKEDVDESDGRLDEIGLDPLLKDIRHTLD